MSNRTTRCADMSPCPGFIRTDVRIVRTLYHVCRICEGVGRLDLGVATAQTVTGWPTPTPPVRPSDGGRDRGTTGTMPAGIPRRWAEPVAGEHEDDRRRGGRR